VRYGLSVQLGPYTVLRRLAAGGMAEVLLALRHGQPVALKRILPHLAGSSEIIALFEEEARIAADLHHPNIVAVHDFSVIDGGHVLALEYVAGIDLRGLRRTCPPPVVAAIAAAVCAGLQHAHAHGVVHGDVSPSNVLLGVDGQVKLCDFGVARGPGRCPARGKRGYAAPEQRGGSLDRRTDLYALALVAHELLEGGRAPLSDGVPPRLAAVIERASRTCLEDRFPTAEAMGAALDLALADVDAPARLEVVAAEVARCAVPEVVVESHESTLPLALDPRAARR